MGGRGAASGVSAQGYQYGTEFKTLISVDNIKFVQPRKTGSSPVPIETMSSGRNRVYVLVNNSGEMKSISFYNSKGHLRRQIDFGHDHGHGSPHTHTGFGSARRTTPLTKSDEAYIRKVRKIWNES
jgi:hypothetical protein